MTLQEAADRLIAIVGHEPAGPRPAGISIPYHAWLEFINVAHPMKHEEEAQMFPMSETPPPVEEPPPEEPPPADDDEDEDKTSVKSGAHKRHRHTR